MAYVTPDPTWMTGLRLVLRSPALQGDYLKVNAAMQRELAEAIADRAGLEMDRDMLPMISGGRRHGHVAGGLAVVARRRPARTLAPPAPASARATGECVPGGGISTGFRGAG
jgi:hypothetical protein